MSVTYKFAATTKTTKDEVIAAEVEKMVTLPDEKEEVIEEQQITIAQYTEFVQRLLPKIKKAKQKNGLIAELVEDKRAPGGGPLVKYTVCTVATIAKEEGVDKSEIQKIWDMA